MASRIFTREHGWTLDQIPQGSGRGTKSAGDKEAFRKYAKKYDLIIGWSCVEPGVGLDDT